MCTAFFILSLNIYYTLQSKTRFSIKCKDDARQLQGGIEINTSRRTTAFNRTLHTFERNSIERWRLAVAAWGKHALASHEPGGIGISTIRIIAVAGRNPLNAGAYDSIKRTFCFRAGGNDRDICIRDAGEFFYHNIIFQWKFWTVEITDNWRHRWMGDDQNH